MRTVLVALVMLILPFSGCTDTGPICCGNITGYLQGEKIKDLDSVHVSIESVELDYVNALGQTQTFSKVLDAVVRIDRALGDKAVFFGEEEVPSGEYSEIRIHLTDAYGVKHGVEYPMSLATSVIVIADVFAEDGMESRIVIDLDGKITKEGGGYHFDNHVGRTIVTTVDDDTSGIEVNDIGDLVALPEAA